MPLMQRKQQILAKIETSEGTNSNPGAGDAIQVFNPSLSDQADVVDRVPAGPTLSRDFTPVGRVARTLTFASDFRGNADTTIPVDEPDWGVLIKACGFRVGSLVLITTSSAPTAGGFALGEIVSDGTARGVVVGFAVGGAPNFGPRMATNGGLVAVAVVSGTFASGALGGESTLSTCTTSAVAAYAGVTYQPTSEKSMTVTTGAWTGTAPAALGEVLRVENGSGVVLGAVQILRDNATGFTNIDVTQLFGSIANGNVLRSAGNGTATISAAPVMKRTPSLTIAHNLDGRRRDLVGARGTFTLASDSVGAPMQFSWTFNGDLAPASDTPQITTTGLSTVRPPRMLGATVCYGLGTQVHKLPTKRVSVDLGAQVTTNLDVNRPGGATGSLLTDRDPSIQVTVDQAHSAFDWEAARDNGTPVRFAAMIGTTSGNIVAINAAICQVTEVTFSDADGVATFDITLKPRRILESGDDELFFSQL